MAICLDPSKNRIVTTSKFIIDSLLENHIGIANFQQRLDILYRVVQVMIIYGKICWRDLVLIDYENLY